uniref:Uncharacterized protein n=1 Tax=Chrysotila carterae TaxID=13221 RepID=A0A7S4AZG3_CHRCT
MLSARGGERERERNRARERERLKKETPRLTFSAFLFGKRSAAAGRAATHLTDFWLHQQVVDDSIQASGIVASRLLMRRRQCVENAGARDGGNLLTAQNISLDRKAYALSFVTMP